MTETAEQFIARKDRDRERDAERGRLLKMKDVGRLGSHFLVREKPWTLMAESEGYPAVFSVERLRYVKFQGPVNAPFGAIGHIEYRLGYWTVVQKGYWGWGQYAQMVPGPDLKRLLTRARENGTILPEHFPALH